MFGYYGIPALKWLIVFDDIVLVRSLMTFSRNKYEGQHSTAMSHVYGRNILRGSPSKEMFGKKGKNFLIENLFTLCRRV